MEFQIEENPVGSFVLEHLYDVQPMRQSQCVPDLECTYVARQLPNNRDRLSGTWSLSSLSIPGIDYNLLV